MPRRFIASIVPRPYVAFESAVPCISSPASRRTDAHPQVRARLSSQGLSAATPPTGRPCDQSHTRDSSWPWRSLVASTRSSVLSRTTAAAAIGEATDAQSRGSRQIDVVHDAAHDVVVEARDAVIDHGPAGFIAVEVPRGVLEILAQLLARDLHRPQRVFVRIDPHEVPLVHIALGYSRLHIEDRGGRQLRPGAAALD